MENIKAIAVKALIDSGIHSLPIDTFTIRSSKKLWVIGAYSENIELFNHYKVKEYSESVKAFTLKEITGEYLIFYDDTLPKQKRDLYIAHEIGHVLLEHTAVGLILGKFENPDIEDMQEKEADVFSMYFLAPSCILANADIISQRDIISTTTIADRCSRNFL